MKTISFDKFVKKYEPLKNSINPDDSYGGYSFETYDEELEHVQRFPNKHIWTLVNTEDELDFIISGFHLVNRSKYFITKKPWKPENIQVNLNEKMYVNTAKYLVLHFLEEENILDQVIEDKLHDYWSNIA